MFQCRAAENRYDLSQCRAAENRCGLSQCPTAENDARYRWEMIVPSMTSCAFERGGAGSSERADAWAAASAARARTGLHTVREPPEPFGRRDVRSHGRSPRRIGMT